MKSYCTLSDKNYLALGIALYKSLENHCSEPFKLYYLCLDDESYNRFLSLGYKDVIPVSLSEMEKKEPELQEARANRPYNEYCWTLASYFSYYLLTVEGVEDSISYIDSDIFFYQDPKIFFEEIGEKSVGIIAHRHNIVGCTDGAYNVGIIYFKNDEKGLEVLKWWRDAVLFKKYPEYHGCGDQKYLEGFIPNFGEENICIADKTFGHGAPWNLRLYSYDKFDEGKIIWGDREQPFVFHHFSRMKFDFNTDEVQPTGGQYADHTLGFQVFNIPAVNLMYRNYYVFLKGVHQTILSQPINIPATPAVHTQQLNIAVGMIIFDGDFILKQCLDAIYPFASQIMIAEGPVKFWQNCGHTTSSDQTNRILDNFPDSKNKIDVIHGQFEEKDDQCKAYMHLLKKDASYIWNIDSDEIYKPEDVEKIIKLLRDEKYTSIGVRPYSFYGGFDHYITGWEEKKDQFLRIFKIYPGSEWVTHRPPTIKHNVENILEPKHLDSDRLYNEHGIRMHHYSYVFPRQVFNKIAYYKAAVSKDKCIDDYFRNVYLPWVQGDELEREMIEQGYKGVHEWKPEFRSETMTAKFEGTHPAVIMKEKPILETKFKLELERVTAVLEKIDKDEKDFLQKMNWID